MQKLDLSNVVYLVDGSAPLWPTAKGFLLSIVFHYPQRQRYKEYLKQGVLLIMNPWSFDEMQQLADRSYPENHSELLAAKTCGCVPNCLQSVCITISSKLGLLR